MLGFNPTAGSSIAARGPKAPAPVDFPTFLPSPTNTQFTVTQRLVVNKFGDGYRQTFGDGPVPIERTHTLSWDPIDKVNADIICSFLDSKIGAVFRYRLPRELAPRTWVWTGRTRSYPYPNDDALSVTLEERFAL